MNDARYAIHLPMLHDKQNGIVSSQAKRKIIRAGRRGGKTIVAADMAVNYFLDHKRVLYAAPTTDQLESFWAAVCLYLRDPIAAGVIKKNENEHTVEFPGSKVRIKGKTAWNADTLRGDFADLLELDEFQLMNEDAWGLVGAPMLLDNNGDAVFIYTPPSLHSRSISKADDPQHAAKLFKQAQADQSGRWQAFHFTSYDNPHISKDALQEIYKDMTALAIRMEILAEDVNEAPGALWKRATLDKYRVITPPTEFEYIVVAVDPSVTSEGDAAGIIVAGRFAGESYTIADQTVQGSPLVWATAAVTAYNLYKANVIVAEANQGGEMVALTIHIVDPGVPVQLVHASRGKQTRAEPIAALYEQGKAHHIGSFPALEDEMCIWIPGDASPNRMDALVWAYSALNTGQIMMGVM